MALKLERLFGSRTRVKLLLLFTNGIRRPYYVRELTRLTKEQINSVRREAENMRKIGLLSTYVRKGKKYYSVNPHFPVLDELTKMTAKVGKPFQDRLFENIRKIGSVKLVILTGLFTQTKGAPTDLLIVGNIQEKALDNFVKELEEELGTEVRFTAMPVTEYEYRRSMNDSFLEEVHSYECVELINNIKAKHQARN